MTTFLFLIMVALTIFLANCLRMVIMYLIFVPTGLDAKIDAQMAARAQEREKRADDSKMSTSHIVSTVL